MNASMSDSWWSGFFGLAGIVVNVVISVLVAAWALRRKVRDQASIRTETTASQELTRMQRSHERRVTLLEQRLDRVVREKDAQIRELQTALTEAKVTIAEQAVELRGLRQDLADFKREEVS